MSWGEILKILIIGAGIGASWYKLNNKLDDVVSAIEAETTSRLALKKNIEKWLGIISSRYDLRIKKLEDKMDDFEKEFFDFIKKNFKKK